jgi:hypothetical protein
MNKPELYYKNVYGKTDEMIQALVILLVETGVIDEDEYESIILKFRHSLEQIDAEMREKIEMEMEFGPPEKPSAYGVFTEDL